MSRNKANDKQLEDGAYYDDLYDFCCAVNKANMKSFEGEQPSSIAKTLKRYYDSFFRLCMVEQPECKVVEKVVEKPVEVVVEKIVEKPVYRNIKRNHGGKVKHINTIRRDHNGWGRCPVCGCKMIKINEDSFILNFPAYCKKCKNEIVVSWCDTTVVQRN